MSSKPRVEEIKKILQTLRICSSDSRMTIQQCDKLLQHRPKDSAIYLHKATLQIRSSNLDGAIKTLRNGPPTNKGNFLLAYCYYRLESFQNALNALDTTPKDVHFDTLRAQILYRLEKFSEAADHFQSILTRAVQENMELSIHDILVNTVASLNEAKLREEIESLLQEHADIVSGDVLMNAYMTSEAHLSNNHIGYLDEKKPLKEIIANGEIVAQDDDGLCGLLVGLFLQAGRTDEAKVYLEALLSRASLSTVLQAVCANNWICLQECSELFESLKKIKQCTAQTVMNKLSSQQKLIVSYNYALLQLHIRKYSAALNIAKGLMSQHTDNPYPSVAAIYATWGISNRSLEAVERFSEEHQLAKPGTASSVYRIIMAQISLQHKEKRNLKNILEVFPPNERYSIGVMSAAIESLESGQDSVSHLLAAIAHWKSKDSENVGTILSLTELLIERLIQCHLYENAAESLEELLSISGDSRLRKKLIYACSFFDVDRAYALGAEEVSFLDENAPTYHESVLEEEEIPQASESTPTSTAQVRHQKKKRKTRKPPIDSEAAPDPDRWKPLRDRESLKKVGKKALARMAEERRQYALEKRMEHAQRVLAEKLDEGTTDA